MNSSLRLHKLFDKPSYWRSFCRSKKSSVNGSDLKRKSHGEKTHFGYQDVLFSDKQRLVSSVFSSVARRYDLMNDLMSLRVHRLWKDAFVKDMSPTGAMRILDCAGGTGDIAFRIADHVERNGGWANNDAGISVCDISSDMLKVGKEKALQTGHLQHISFVIGDAERLPFADEYFDIYAISFGMRNVPRPNLALKEALRVLKPGGRFIMLEFGKVKSGLVSQMYDAWSFAVIPTVGRVIAQDEASYRYLIESIRRFPSQTEFLSMVENSGFSSATVTDYSFGIAACYSAFKSPDFGAHIVEFGA